MTWNVPGFRAERRLGRGATGEVWAGRDDATGEPVALKRLRPGAGEVDRDRLRSEAAMLGAFQHPNVIGLRGVLGTDDSLVLILDLALGGSLAQLLAHRDRLRSGQVVALFGPLADALAAAHAAGLLHGDVSPGNVLLALDGRPLLADLGTARLAGDDASPAHGTSGYIDPAVRAGTAPVAASDVYSLAAVAARALTGRAVAESADGLHQWADHAHTLGVPSALVLALCAALDADPARRPDAAAFARQLRAAGPAESLASVVPGLPVAGEDPDGAGPRRSRASIGQHWLPGSGASMDSGGLAGSGGLERSGGLAGSGGLERSGGLTGPAVGAASDAFTRRVPRPVGPPEPVERPRGWSRWRAWRSEQGSPGMLATGACEPPQPPARFALPAGHPDRFALLSWRPGRFARLPGTPPPAQRPVWALARSVGVAAIALMLVVVAAFAWTATDPSPEPPARLADRAPASPQEWTRIVAALDTRRESAFALAEQRLLGEVYLPGSPPLVADQQAVRSLRAARAVALGVRHDIRQVRVLAVEGQRVRLEVTDRMPAYRIVDAAGSTLRTVPTRGEEVVWVELAHTPAGWRIAAINPAG